VFSVKKSGKCFFVKKVDLSSTQGALCAVSVFFLFYILLIWGGGAYTHPTKPPAYGPGAYKKSRRTTFGDLVVDFYAEFLGFTRSGFVCQLHV